MSLANESDLMNLEKEPKSKDEIDPQLHELMSAVRKNQIKKASKIITAKPHLLTQRRVSMCNMPGCGCISEISPIEYLISGTGDDSHHVDRIPMLISFFEQKLIKPEHFTDHALFEFMKYNVSSGYQCTILDVLIKYIPKEQWVGLRSKADLNILYAVLFSHMDEDKMEYYFKVYMDMGVDPMAFSGDHEDEGDIYQQGSIIRLLIHSAMSNLLRYILTKFKPERSYFNEIRDGKFDQDENAMMICLRNNARQKDRILIRNVRETFQICLENELDVNHKNKYSETIHDYVAFYQWQTVLSNLIELPVDAGQNMEQRLNMTEFKDKPTWANLMEYIREEGRRKIPASNSTLSTLTDFCQFLDLKLKVKQYEKDPAQNHLLEMELLSHLKTIQYAIYSDLASSVREKCDPLLNSNDTIDLIENILLSNLQKHDGNLLNTIHSIEEELLIRNVSIPNTNLIISKFMITCLETMKYGGLMGTIIEGLHNACECAYGYLYRPFVKEWEEKLIEHKKGFN